jgi:hypothetical protein
MTAEKAEAADDTSAGTDGTTADDDATDEDPCTPEEEDPKDPGTADATSSSLLGVLSKSSTVVRASRRPRRPELS